MNKKFKSSLINKDEISSSLVKDSTSCDLSELNQKIDLIFQTLGNSGSCYVSQQGESICPETIYEKLNDLSSDKIGINDGIPGQNTVFQILNSIKEGVFIPSSSFGEETLFGKAQDIKQKTDLIGSVDDISSESTLFGKLTQANTILGTTSDDGNSNTIYGNIGKDTGNSTLFQKIDALPNVGTMFAPSANNCFLKAMARIVGAMTPVLFYLNDGNYLNAAFFDPDGDLIPNSFYLTVDSYNSQNVSSVQSAHDAAYDYITNPSNWSNFSC